jgi:hypothetical protein
MKARVAPVGRVVVAEPQKFGNRVRPSFAKSVGILDASLKQLPQAGNEIALILRGPQGETVGGDQVALPLARGAAGPYWLSAKIVLEPYQNKYALKGISLTVFRGEPRSEKAPLVRAEWDCPIGIVNAHAQPHWHAYPEVAPLSHDVPTSTLEILDPQQVILELPDAVETASQPHPDGFTRVHLAMATTWHLAKNPQDRVLMVDETAVFAWIENCIRYLKNQLTSLN